MLAHQTSSLQGFHMQAALAGARPPGRQSPRLWCRNETVRSQERAAETRS
jgi:hypothetical protein